MAIPLRFAGLRKSAPVLGERLTGCGPNNDYGAAKPSGARPLSSTARLETRSLHVSHIAGRFSRGVRMPRRNHLLVHCLVGAIAVVSLGASGAAAQTRNEREAAARGIPYDRLTPAAAGQIHAIVDSPTLYRRLPTQAIDCDPRMFIFLVRNPEVLVGIWERMEVSKVTTQRIGPYQLAADDSAGTQCQIDLVYGDTKTHVFVATGSYSGGLAPRPITGSGVFVLQSGYAEGAEGRTTVTGTLDCYIQLDSLGADLVARSLSRLIGRTADHNFVETARFMSQISHAAEQNPSGMRDLAMDLRSVEAPTREAFATAIVDVARRAGNHLGATVDTRVPFIARRENP